MFLVARTMAWWAIGGQSFSGGFDSHDAPRPLIDARWFESSPYQTWPSGSPAWPDDGA